MTDRPPSKTSPIACAFGLALVLIGGPAVAQDIDPSRLPDRPSGADPAPAVRPPFAPGVETDAEAVSESVLPRTPEEAAARMTAFVRGTYTLLGFEPRRDGRGRPYRGYVLFAPEGDGLTALRCVGGRSSAGTAEVDMTGPDGMPILVVTYQNSGLETRFRIYADASNEALLFGPTRMGGNGPEGWEHAFKHPSAPPTCE